ncbi:MULTISPECIES: hypothetical protein [unclassified Bifidobacterium]|uniref:hypothetical protein n=1 Tax=unclassified Bifidobacterium TaxID=2608897 RepID=UPI0015E3589B|nr:MULTISPECIES: hypothetical protein [unclassified Bifidobacterium]
MADLTELARVGDRIQLFSLHFMRCCLPLNASNHENCVAWQKSAEISAAQRKFHCFLR